MQLSRACHRYVNFDGSLITKENLKRAGAYKNCASAHSNFKRDLKMGENFQKIKKKTLLGAVIKCVVCGVSLGLFAVGATLLTLKLIGIPLAFYYYIIIGVGVAALSGGLTFLIVKPNEKKLAKQLDNEYSLNEKVQTSLTFANEAGAVIEIQRADTEMRLASLPKKRFSLAKIWQFILIPVMSIAIQVPAYILPSNYAQGAENPEVEQGELFDFREEYIIVLDELIEDVKASDLEDNLKASVVTLLKRLQNNLFTLTYESQVQKFYNQTITGINDLVNEAYSYEEIATVLAKYDQYRFAVVIANAARTYRNYRLADYSDVESYAAESLDVIAKVVEDEDKGLPPIFKDIKSKKDNGETDNTRQLIFTALAASTVSSSDNLYRLFLNLARDLANDQLNEFQFELDLEDEIARQTYIRAMRVYIFNVLGKLFDYPVPDDPNFIPEEKKEDGGGAGDDDEDKTNQGGYGTGDWKNNFQVYDPRTGQYGNYMDILQDYFALVDEMLRSPDISEEQQSIINAYFQILFNGDIA